MDQVLVNRMIRVLYLLADNLNHTVDEIANKAQTSQRTVYRYLQAFKDAGMKVICRYGSVYKIEKWWQAWDDKEPTKQKTDCNNINPERGIVLQRPLQDLKRPDGTYELLEQFNDKGFMNDMPYLQKCVANVDLLVTASSSSYVPSGRFKSCSGRCSTMPRSGLILLQSVFCLVGSLSSHACHHFSIL